MGHFSVFFLMFMVLMLVYEAKAETVTLNFTESVVNTGAGNPALKECIIHMCHGATCTDFAPKKSVSISTANGGGVRSIPITINLNASQLPSTYRFGISCRTVNGNESPLHTPGVGAGNPITFQGS